MRRDGIAGQDKPFPTLFCQRTSKEDTKIDGRRSGDEAGGIVVAGGVLEAGGVVRRSVCLVGVGSGVGLVGEADARGDARKCRVATQL